MYKVFLFAFVFLLKYAFCCERPLEVRGVEDYCWTQKVEILDRIQHAQKSVVNFAKRKLGMDVTEPNEPQKCDYYNCILSEMNVLTSDRPNDKQIAKWIKKNVIYNQAINLLDRLRICNEEYENSTSSGSQFLSDNVNQNSEGIDLRDGNTDQPQSNCEIAAEYLKCLSIGDNQECPIFQYP